MMVFIRKNVKFLLALTLFITLLSGCSNDKEKSEPKKDNADEEILKLEMLKENVDTSVELTPNGRFVFTATNNNDINVDVAFVVILFDDAGEEIKRLSNRIDILNVGADSVAVIDNTVGYYARYETQVFVASSGEFAKGRLKDIKVTDKSEDNGILVQATNTSDSSIDVCDVAVVFYNYGKTVEIDYDYGFDIKEGRTKTFMFDYPVSTYGYPVQFSEYKVFVTECYSYETGKD